jgi:hypothetical protein
MVVLMYHLPEARNPLHPLFWGVMSAATLVGGIAAYPINSWMVKRHVKHGMMSAPQAAPAMAGMNMKDMKMPAHAAAPLSFARQAGVVALTLAALAIAIAITTRFAPIRL